MEDEQMDWIEKIFGVSPDGGDGSTEALIVATCIVLLGAIIAARVPVFRIYLRNLFFGRSTGT
jgi:hypothetical protein